MKAQQIAPSSIHIVRGDEVREIRYKLWPSQPEFATMIGVTLSTLQGWEDGKRLPDGPALAVLRVAAKTPTIVAKGLGH
jgi:putative transcriptional regulator